VLDAYFLSLDYQSTGTAVILRRRKNYGVKKGETGLNKTNEQTVLLLCKICSFAIVKQLNTVSFTLSVFRIIRKFGMKINPIPTKETFR
jgi:hypothetical protein